MSTDDDVRPGQVAMFVMVEAWACEHPYEEFERLVLRFYDETAGEIGKRGGPTREQLKGDLPGMYADARKRGDVGKTMRDMPGYMRSVMDAKPDHVTAWTWTVACIIVTALMAEDNNFLRGATRSAILIISSWAVRIAQGDVSEDIPDIDLQASLDYLSKLLTALGGPPPKRGDPNPELN